MKYNVKTAGMGCAHCIANMTKAMEAMNAKVTRMELNDFDIEFEGTPDEIRAAVTELGFDFISAEEK
ncbi:MAG: hypothetical protein IKG85_04900 [Clostridia bacterium]|nr:hypothetical protein [Clostridia bacterium]